MRILGKYWLIAAFIILNALLAILLSFFLLNLNYLNKLNHELDVLFANNFLKHYVLDKPENTTEDDYLFIDLAYEKRLIDKYSDEGYLLGKEVITDRGQITAFLQLLGQARYRYIILDVFFADSTAQDLALQTEMDKHPRLIVPYHREESGAVMLPRIKARTGLADYSRIEDKFLKFTLLTDTARSLPLLMYQDIHGKEYRRQGIFWKLGEKRVFNTFILPFFVRHYHLQQEGGKYSLLYLNDFFHLGDPAFIEDMVRDKILVLGNFSDQDIHMTLYGDQPGPLILVNAYEALVKGYNEVTSVYLFFLFLAFAFLSMVAVLPQNSIKAYVGMIVARKKNKNWLMKLIMGFFGWFFLLALISLLSTMIFSIHLSIMFLSFYFLGVQKLIEKLRGKGLLGIR